MKMNEKTLEMIRALSDAPGASGFEEAVTAAARGYIDGIGRVEEDFLHNLYIYRSENEGGRPVIMLDAHADEVGFIVQAIKPNGTLRFLTLGGWNKNAMVSSKVLVRNAKGEYIPGIIASKPVHHMSAAEKANLALEVSDMVIDVGAVSMQDAVENYHLRIGEPVVPATKFDYDEAHGVMFGKAFDCRIGCAVILEVLRRMQGKTLPCDVAAVLSAQEEIGTRGCKVTVNRVQPDIAVVLEGCPADDTFAEPYMIQTALKKGPMLRHIDVSAICAPRYQRWALDLAREKGIPVQEAVRSGGGNNASVFQTSLLGAPSIVVGVPVRYAHSCNCMTTAQDFEASVQLVCALLENITPEMIAAL